MCVILLWPSKIKGSLILMQNVFKVCSLRTNWLKILIFEDLGWIQVLLKNFSSHIHAFFFIKQCALRSFCIKMLCFSKIWFFQTFDRSNLFFDQSKLRLKFLVWPTKFANTLNFLAKQIWCLKIYEECLKILILAKLGPNQVFLKSISSHTRAFYS